MNPMCIILCFLRHGRAGFVPISPSSEIICKAIFDAQLCQMTVDVLMRIDETVSDEDFKVAPSCVHVVYAW